MFLFFLFVFNIHLIEGAYWQHRAETNTISKIKRGGPRSRAVGKAVGRISRNFLHEGSSAAVNSERT